VPWFTVANRLRSTAGGPREIEVNRAPGSRVVTVTGTAPAGSGAARESLAVDDPAIFAAAVFKLMLERQGITVNGEAVARHRLPGDLYAPHGGMVLARRVSPELIEILKVINKESQNLHAELALLAAARAAGRDASREGSLALLKEWLTGLGVAETQHAFQDGSGLTRRNLVSPSTITTMLAAMHASEHREAFRDTLPVAGEDGTLAGRFRGMKDVTPIRAKTGTISHVAALSGYAGDDPERRIAFSIMVNHAVGPPSEARALIDKIAVAILRKGFE
jgi:D-alanyl-D-alanine carboxypeptidase/D-alanyl-D-alanine-endopeptidase (penicillin-binding protein 4)